jgi:hypothetical protein
LDKYENGLWTGGRKQLDDDGGDDDERGPISGLRFEAGEHGPFQNARNLRDRLFLGVVVGGVTVKGIQPRLDRSELGLCFSELIIPRVK